MLYDEVRLLLLPLDERLDDELPEGLLLERLPDDDLPDDELPEDELPEERLEGEPLEDDPLEDDPLEDDPPPELPKLPPLERPPDVAIARCPSSNVIETGRLPIALSICTPGIKDPVVHKISTAVSVAIAILTVSFRWHCPLKV
ncbi:MAG: hypothetical protein AAFY72_01270 [Cyanobacteria bacterium J06649_4]